ncbi:hypothetical protein FX988_00175 [Paraglaciecola mesophila]|uniref:Uncharacterized protein n=1 Tax=Paraglaciecola mesophila TaxID=197222 RepID=A0A857JE54_9ALTE|nr:hypothetical protein [Paraglaciecola mesophila]QHJ09966.1 hypothetical protein FX988_00175 [Paraglaciecola mesophila]
MKSRYGKQYRLGSQYQMRLFVDATGINYSGKACERFMGTVYVDPVTGQEVVNGKFTRAFHGRTQLHPSTYDEIKKAANRYGMAKVYDHPLWELIGEEKEAAKLETQSLSSIAEIAAEIKKTCLAEHGFSPLSIGRILTTNNELDVIAAHITLLRTDAVKNRDVLLKLLKGYLCTVAFAIAWRSLRFINEEFCYYMQNIFFDNPKTNLSFIIDNAYPDFKTLSFARCLGHVNTINMFTNYLMSVAVKRTEKAKYRMRVYIQFIEIEQLIEDLDFVHGIVDSSDTRNNFGLLALLAATGNKIKLNSYRGTTKIINNSQTLPNGRSP